jgi:uncharacterized integral membrane protein (TIGR00698 family)
MLLPGASPALALAVGAALALTLGNPFPWASARGAPLLLKTSVVGLGFGMSLAALGTVGLAEVATTVAVVLGSLACGLLLGRMLRVPGETSLLIACGTGICGGSAIAAVGSAIGARAESMSAALATVFVLNAVALYAFPATGLLLGLSEAQFGVWAAVAIHDTSSVVGAAAAYGATALAVATVLKLVRALWIVPLTLGVGFLQARRQGAGAATRKGVSMPWFILLFAVAVAIRSAAPLEAEALLDALARAARTGLVLTLFLIGAGLTRTTLARVGGRPFLQGLVLWLLVAGATLAAVVLRVPA